MFTYKFMNKKYGLRSLAIDNTAALILSCESFSSEDSDVNAFYKIFKNEIGEDYLAIQADLNRSIDDLLMAQLMGKYPLKSQADLKEEFTRKVKGLINEYEWSDIVKYLYNPRDGDKLCAMLREINIENIDEKNNDDVLKKKKFNYLKTPASSKPLKREIKAIPFVLFKKTVLDYQCKSQMEYLKDVSASFRKNDTDTDGVVNTQEFELFFQDLRKLIFTNTETLRSLKSAADVAKRSLSPTPVVVKYNSSSAANSIPGGAFKGAPLSPEKKPVVIKKRRPATMPLAEVKYEFNDSEKNLLEAVFKLADPFYFGKITFSSAVYAVAKSGALRAAYNPQIPETNANNNSNSLMSLSSSNQ